MHGKRKKLNSLDVEIPEHFYKKWVVDPFIPVKTRRCEHGHCSSVGEYRAPKGRDKLDEYYWFCLDHVRAYNAQWDYYAGMNSLEIEEAIRFGAQWERPTWPMGQARAEQQLREAFKGAFGGGFDHQLHEEEIEEKPPHKTADMQHIDPRYRAEVEALMELGLHPPVDFETIKKRYRQMVKRHHPDMHSEKGQAARDDANDKIKRLNGAFTILKTFYMVDETP